MKSLYILLVMLIVICNTGYSQNAWNTSGTGTGDFLKADFPDSMANKHPHVQADTVSADVFNKNTPTLWDVPLVAPDTTVIDSSKAWIKTDLVNPAGAKCFFHIENFATGKLDTLGFAAEMSPIVNPADTAYIWIICEDTTKVDIDVYVISGGDTILVSTITATEDNDTSIRSTWYKHAIPFTASFADNEPAVFIVRARIDAGAWVRFSSSLRIM
jgi:hypothetical protein